MPLGLMMLMSVVLKLGGAEISYHSVLWGGSASLLVDATSLLV